MQMRHASDWFARSATVAVLTLFAVIAVYPIVFMVLSSFKTIVEYINDPVGWPATFRYIENYQAMIYRFNVPRLFGNTIWYVLLATVLSLAVSVPASFAFAKLRFRFSQGLRTLMIATLIVPAMTLLVPTYVLFANLGLVDSYISVVLIWAATSVPGSVFLLSSLMRAIPTEVLEAARIDGAGYFQMMRRVVLPLSGPGILTVTIFNVTVWWNDLLIPLVFLQSDETKTITVAAATIMGRFSSDTPMLITGLLFASLPPILVYIFLQRYIRRGLVVGALK
ncbi:MAG: carbohydrate ABC transporter permease [Thermomicrobiales bacterium]|nr:carbohydrate ABC transporter permease [Thermomicrobiales bacterium]